MTCAHVTYILLYVFEPFSPHAIYSVSWERLLSWLFNSLVEMGVNSWGFPFLKIETSMIYNLAIFTSFFNSSSVILGRWPEDNERLCTMELHLRLRRFSLEQVGWFEQDRTQDG